jgi:uncharacterized protein (UPF0332 family)
MNKFLNKLMKERKLQIVDVSEEISDSYRKKSESNLISSKILSENERFEESVSLAYYSMYNISLSLLFKVGIKCENHKACAILLKEIFDLDNLPLIQSKEERIDKQYYVGFKISKEEVKKSIEIAEEFNKNLRGFILSLNNFKIKEYRDKFLEVIK